MLIVTDDPHGVRPVMDELVRRGRRPSCFSLSRSVTTANGVSVLTTGTENVVTVSTDSGREEITPDSRVWRWKDRSAHTLAERRRDPIDEMKRQQNRSLLRSVWESPAWWMNSWSAERRLDQNKTLGATTAARHGLRVPPTIVTDWPDAARDFIEQHASDTYAIKAPAMWAARLQSGQTIATYTTRVDRGDLESLVDQVRYGPVIIQPYIEKRHELRVTIVNDIIFTCRIMSQEIEGARVDWRMRPNDPVPHERTRLDKTVARALRAMMREWDLTYAAFDLIVTPADEIVFLEVNPAGQYLWVEGLTGLPITSAIADWLEADVPGRTAP